MIPDSFTPARIEHCRSLEYGRAVAMKLAADPQAGFELARRNLAKPWAARAAQDRVGVWRRLVDAKDLDGVVAVLLEETGRGLDLRGAMPFSGLLSQAERAEVGQRAMRS